MLKYKEENCKYCGNTKVLEEEYFCDFCNKNFDEVHNEEYIELKKQDDKYNKKDGLIYKEYHFCDEKCLKKYIEKYPYKKFNDLL